MLSDCKHFLKLTETNLHATKRQYPITHELGLNQLLKYYGFAVSADSKLRDV